MSATALADQNKAIARRLFEDVWNKGNLALIDEFHSSNYVHHDVATPDLGKGPESAKKLVTLYRTAFPDINFTIDDIIAEGDKVALSWTNRATHKGELQGIAPTGKEISVTGIVIFRFSGGKIEESRVSWDALGLMKQLGVVTQ